MLPEKAILQGNIIPLKGDIDYEQVVGTSRQSIEQYTKTLRLIEAKKIDLRGLITERFKLEQWRYAFQGSQTGDGLKNIFLP